MSNFFRKACGCAALSFVTAIPLLASDTAQASQPTSYNRKQLREMVQHARTAEDHKRLAAYFRTQQTAFRHREAAQLQLLEEYYQNHKDHPGKFPTRGDTARHLASSYSLQSQQAAQHAAEQDELAGSHETERFQW